MDEKYCSFSLSTPIFNNVRAASALPYYLVLGAKWNGNCEVEVWTFNLNSIDADSIRETLDYDFMQEKNFSYKDLNINDAIIHTAKFISEV